VRDLIARPAPAGVPSLMRREAWRPRSPRSLPQTQADSSQLLALVLMLLAKEMLATVIPLIVAGVGATGGWGSLIAIGSSLIGAIANAANKQK